MHIDLCTIFLSEMQLTTGKALVPKRYADVYWHARGQYQHTHAAAKIHVASHAAANAPSSQPDALVYMSHPRAATALNRCTETQCDVAMTSQCFLFSEMIGFGAGAPEGSASMGFLTGEYSALPTPVADEGVHAGMCMCCLNRDTCFLPLSKASPRRVEMMLP